MSHVNENNAVCPNCNTELKGEFCYECGQQRIHHPETVSHFVRHFFDDITHFDSKFFKSLIPLLYKPGFLTTEYVAGRRARYLHPIRAYLFLSFVYFLLFFSFSGSKEILVNAPLVSHEAEVELDSLKNTNTIFKLAVDSINSENENITTLIDSLKKSDPRLKRVLDSLSASQHGFVIDPVAIGSNSVKSLDNISVNEYEELQRTVPDSLRDPWFQRIMVKRALINRDKFHSDPKAIWTDSIDKLMHNIPKILFFILPVFALLLKMLYVRRNVFYVAHAIFSLHFFSFLFILFSLDLIINKFIHYDSADWIVLILVILYLYLALRNCFMQSRMKTIIKLLLLLITFSFVVIITFVISLIISFLS